MSTDEDARNDNGKDQVRLSGGKFGPKATDSTQSPLKPEVKKKSSIHDPLFSFTINNPFTKILQWLDYLRRHQITTFDFKIKIPIVALPIFLVVVFGLFQGFFTLGQYTKNQEIAAIPTPTPIIIIESTTTPAPIMGSYLGVLQATYQIPSTTLSPPDELFTTNRYILLDREDKILFLKVASTLNMNPYLGRRVLITGLYDTSDRSLEVASSTDIEIVR